jgi:hypothetical protein
MHRSTVTALLAAVAAGLSVIDTLIHGRLIWAVAGYVAVVTWFATIAPGSAARVVLRRRRRDTLAQSPLVAATSPVEAPHSSLREALDVAGRPGFRELREALDACK